MIMHAVYQAQTQREQRTYNESSQICKFERINTWDAELAALGNNT